MKYLGLLCLFFTLISARVEEYKNYFKEAGIHYDIPPLLLENIVSIESGGNPNVIRVNSNGTKDYGLMQINTIHLRRLSAWGICERNILDPKINIFAGSWLLSEHIKERGFNLQAIGDYHSKTQIHKGRWLKKLIVALKKSS